MSQEKKYQVFISSTYTDLIEARSAAINTVLESYNFPVGMELFGADNDEQWTIIKDLIDSSDFYILILGHRYGSISKEDGISFTEKEFDYAVSNGLKLICFVRNDNVATHPHERDQNSENLDKLKFFRQKVLTNRLCEFWDSVDDLKHKISHSLYKNMRKHGGIGWVRGNQISGQLAEEIAKLSEENRELREKISAYEKEKEIREPNLILTITNTQSPSLNFKLIYSNELDSYKIRYPIIIDDVDSDIREYLTTEIIDDFNARLAKITSDDIEKYNSISKKIDLLKHTRYPLNLFLMNQGNLKANNIHIHIEIPDFLFIIEEGNDSKLLKIVDELLQIRLEVISAPLYDPIAQIIQKKNRINSISKPFTSSAPMIRRSSSVPSSLKRFDGPNKDFLTDEDRTIFIKRAEMMHTSDRGFSYDDYTLVPIGTGSGLIRIKLICEEYLEERTYEIPITVE